MNLGFGQLISLRGHDVGLAVVDHGGDCVCWRDSLRDQGPGYGR